MKDVHTEHCCRFHGCKYGSNDCTVVNKGVLQAYPCEDCTEAQGREIQEERHPRCGALPRDPRDLLPCFLRAGHPTPIHRSLTGLFTRTRPSEVASLVPSDDEPSVTFNEPPTVDPQQWAGERVERRRAMLSLEEAIEKAEGLGRGKAWDALHLIQAILNRQDATIKRIQSAYLDLIEQRILGVCSDELVRTVLDELREDLKK